MQLEEALNLLARVHTRDDEGAGFIIEMGAVPDNRWDYDHYAEAWEEVRRAVKLRTKPEEYALTGGDGSNG